MVSRFCGSAGIPSVVVWVWPEGGDNDRESPMVTRMITRHAKSNLNLKLFSHTIISLAGQTKKRRVRHGKSVQDARR